MYISIGTIITVGSLIGALGVIGGVLIAAYKFFRKPAELEQRIEKIRKTQRKISARSTKSSASSHMDSSPV